MREPGLFTRMCDELSRSLTPRLQALGFAPSAEAFSHRTIKYEFKRGTPDGMQVLEILFNKYRKPMFSVQLYVAPASGLSTLIERGGTLVIGNVSASPRMWPFSLQHFRAAPTALERVLGRSRDRVKDSVESFLALIPEIEAWWAHQVTTRHITVSTLTYPGVVGRPGR